MERAWCVVKVHVSTFLSRWWRYDVKASLFILNDEYFGTFICADKEFKLRQIA